MKATTIYDLLAPAYGKLVPPFTGLTVSLAARRVAAGSPDTVVELGVGAGKTFRELKKKSSARIVALDISAKMLRNARLEAHVAKSDASLVQGNVVELPFADGVFDAALSTFLVNLIPKSQVSRALSEMARVVAPGGRFVIGHLDVESPLLAKLWHIADQVFPQTFGIMRPLDMTGFYEQAGLRVIQDEAVRESLGTRVTTLMKVRG